MVAARQKCSIEIVESGAFRNTASSHREDRPGITSPGLVAVIEVALVVLVRSKGGHGMGLRVTARETSPAVAAIRCVNSCDDQTTTGSRTSREDAFKVDGRPFRSATRCVA
jgi:hypothetical protein